MRFEDQEILLAWSKLMLQIAIAKNPAAKMDMSERYVTRSIGYKRLRRWFLSLSPRAKQGARRFMGMQIEGTRQLLAKARATGETIELGDIVIETFDDSGNEVAPVDLERAKACSSSGAGIPGLSIGADGNWYVKCPTCAATWRATETKFAIPLHEPKEQ